MVIYRTAHILQWDAKQQASINTQNVKRLAATKAATSLFFLVDLRRFELRSAQGNHTFSTCLFQPSIFVPQQDLNHQLRPYPLNFTYASRRTRAISDLPAPLDPQIRNNILGAVSRSII